MAGNIGGKEVNPGGYSATKVLVGGEKCLGIMLEFNIYESMVANVTTADITLADSQNLLSNLPITEGTLVEFEATSIPEAGHPEGGTITQKFEVVKVINRQTVKQDVQVYTLILASNVWSANIKYRMSKSFKQKKYSEIATAVYYQILAKDSGLQGGLEQKGMQFDETDGMYDVVIPNWKPLTILNWLAARSQKKDATNYLFWEDIKQYNFRSVDRLMQKGPVQTYYHQTMNVKGGDQTGYFNAETVNFIDTMDILMYGINGMLGNRLLEVDFTKKLITDFTKDGEEGGCYQKDEPFSYASSFGKTKHADSSGKPLVDGGISEAFEANSKLSVMPKHSWLYNTTEHFEQEKWFRERFSQRAALDYFLVNIWCIGSFQRKVGEKITFMYHSPESGEATPDKKVSGDYLVRAIRRKFDQTKYTMVLELAKDNSL